MATSTSPSTTTSSAAPSATPSVDPAWLNAYAGNDLIAVSATFMVLTTLFVALRFWSRRVQQTTVGWDDYLIYPALIACWVSEATCIAIVPNGGVGTRAAKWVATGQEHMLSEWAIWIYIVEMCYLVAVCLTKLALLAIYLRVLRDPMSRKITYFMMGITIAALISETIACSLQCIPFSYQWNKDQPGHCFNQIAYYQFLSIPNILTDVVLLGLPIPTVWRLHTSRSQKVQLTFVFALGSFGLISSILRFSNFFTTNALADPTYNSVILLTWTVIEPGMYLISACLPTLRPLVNLCLSKIGASDTLKKSGGKGYSSGNQYGKKGNAIPLNQTIGSKRFERLTDGDEYGSLNKTVYTRTDSTDKISNPGESPLSPDIGENNIVVTRDILVSSSRNSRRNSYSKD